MKLFCFQHHLALNIPSRDRSRSLDDMKNEISVDSPKKNPGNVAVNFSLYIQAQAFVDFTILLSQEFLINSFSAISDNPRFAIDGCDGFDTDGSNEGFKKNSPDDFSEASEGSSRSSVELIGKLKKPS